MNVVKCDGPEQLVMPTIYLLGTNLRAPARPLGDSKPEMGDVTPCTLTALVRTLVRHGSVRTTKRSPSPRARNSEVATLGTCRHQAGALLRGVPTSIKGHLGAVEITVVSYSALFNHLCR